MDPEIVGKMALVAGETGQPFHALSTVHGLRCARTVELAAQGRWAALQVRAKLIAAADIGADPLLVIEEAKKAAVPPPPDFELPEIAKALGIPWSEVDNVVPRFDPQGDLVFVEVGDPDDE